MEQASTTTRTAPLDAEGQPMTVWQIWLKRLCVVTIAWALIELAVGIGAVIASNLLSDTVIAGIKVREAAALVGASALFGASLNLIIGLLGICGARRPHKITLFFWITLCDAVLTAWALASNVSSGIIDPTSIVSGLFIIALAVCAWQVRGQTGYFDLHP